MILTRQLARELSLSFPGSFFASRNKKSLISLIELARKKGLEFIVVISAITKKEFSLNFIKINMVDFKYFKKANLILIKTRKELFKSKQKIDFLELKLSKSKKFFSELNLESTESDFLLVEESSSFSFYFNEMEIGPRFKLVLSK